LNLAAEPFLLMQNLYCSAVLDNGRLMGWAEPVGNRLDWNGANGGNGRLEKSVDGHFFFPVGAAGNVLEDGWLDTQPEMETWYRLVWNEGNSGLQFSNVVEIEREKKPVDFSPIYRGNALWDCGNSQMVRVWDLHGRLLLENSKQAGWLDLNSFPPGIYGLTGIKDDRPWSVKICR
jgi:hypothetical protein